MSSRTPMSRHMIRIGYIKIHPKVIPVITMALSVKLDDSMKERVQALAAERQRSPHWIMKEAIRQYVETEEAKASFEKEALDSWRHYRETGLHLTGGEVQDWLKTWGTDEQAEAPECHE